MPKCVGANLQDNLRTNTDVLTAHFMNVSTAKKGSFESYIYWTMHHCNS